MAPDRHHAREATGGLGRMRSLSSWSRSMGRRTGTPLLRSWRGDQVGWFLWSAVFCVLFSYLAFIFVKKLPHHKDSCMMCYWFLCPGSCASLDPAMDLPDAFLWSYYSGFYLTLPIFFLTGDENWLAYCVILWETDFISCLCVISLWGNNFVQAHASIGKQHQEKPHTPKWFEHESCVS